MANFDSDERSNDSGTPVHLYEFRLGTKSWRYASSDHDITVGGVTYTSAPIYDEGVTQSGDASGDDLKITMPPTLEVTNLYVATPPTESVAVLLRRYHYGNTVAPVVWNGIVRNTSRRSASAFEFSCRALLASLNRVGLRLAWGRNCPYALYDAQCKVNRFNYAVTTPVLTKGGDFVRASGLDSYENGYFAGGYIQFPLGMGGATERMGIVSQVADRLNLMGTTDKLAVGTSIMIFPGCARTPTVCNTKFNNLLNYGGFPHMPDKSPFDGDPIF